MSARSVFLTCASFILLAGCASFPKSAAVSAFAEATATASNLLQSAAKADLTLAQKTGYEEAVTSYLTRSKRFDFPPKDYPLLEKAQIAARIDVLKALSSYAAALAELEDPQQPIKIANSISTLGLSVTNLAHLLAPQSNFDRLEPSAGLVSSSMMLIVSQRNAHLIRNTANAVHPLVKRAVELLTVDFETFSSRFSRALENVRATQKQKLIYISDDPTVSRIELERRFQDQYTADQELATQIAALKESKHILEALLKAHDELQSSSDDDRAISEFKSFVDGLTLHLAELKKP